MNKSLFRSCLLGIICLLSFVNVQAFDPARAQISILTCGVGEELYASFGHSAIRIQDTMSHEDYVYNYGVFDFSDPDFYSKFTRGKLLYFVAKDHFKDFMEEYVVEKRKVVEQKLNLTNEEKNSVIQFLETNIMPSNAYYKYDFLYDNCATRIRDVFTKTLGANFKFGQVPSATGRSFRWQLNQSLATKHWERFGIDILLGSPTDYKMTLAQTMFLPDNLETALAKSTLNGQRLVGSQIVLLNQDSVNNVGLNGPFWTFILVLIVVNIAFAVKKLANFKNTISFILLFFNGLLGFFILFMWLGTDHVACSLNWNVLWALPWNLFVAFTIFKPRKWHKPCALFSILLILGALIINITDIQSLPLFELLPLLLSYVFVYFGMIKQSEQVRQPANA